MIYSFEVVSKESSRDKKYVGVCQAEDLNDACQVINDLFYKRLAITNAYVEYVEELKQPCLVGDKVVLVSEVTEPSDLFKKTEPLNEEVQ